MTLSTTMKECTMPSMQSLAEQRILEAEAHLKRVDELMTQARPAPPAAGDELLARLDAERAELKRALEGLQRAPVHEPAQAVEAGTGLAAKLRSLGDQIEKLLTAVGDRRHR
jgi:hypothetical protein